MRTINEYRADMLTILGDASGRRYTNNMLDMGIREALRNYCAFFPKKETINMRVSEIDGVSIILSGMLPPDAQILTARNAAGYWLEFADYRTDQKIYLNIYGKKNMPAVGENLKLEVAAPHSISGLGPATITTIPEAHEIMVCKGASGYAMRIRARSVTEVFGKRPEDREALMTQADQMINEYIEALGNAQPAVYDPLPRGGFPI